MILEPRQEVFVDLSRKALTEHENTVGIAPTGAGKTVMLSAVAGNYERSLILQHREYLIDQNLATFKKINSHKCDVFQADRKKFLTEGATFAMVQTLMRDKNLARMKPVDLLTVDEAHHAAAGSYKAIINQARILNPKVHIFGVTATPTRGDKKPLKTVFTNVSDVITLEELISFGRLVKPRTLVIDCGLKGEIDEAREYAKKQRLADFDMTQVEAIMDKQAVTDKVISEWKKYAHNRRTVVFCSTLKHAHDVTLQYKAAGVNAAMVSGDMKKSDREKILSDLDKGVIQVVVNVAVLTEGFDSQPVSCIVLLRPCSHKSTMMQMIGRGLRRVDAHRYPGIIKDDCVVLDFGYSLITHGDLKVEINLNPQRFLKKMPCPNCEGIILAASVECPLCGADLHRDGDELSADGSMIDFRLPVPKEILRDFVMTEVDLFASSPFQWEEFFNGLVMIANGLSAWGAVISFKGRWHAVGGVKDAGMKVISNCATRFDGLAAADEFLRENGDSSKAKKSKQWLHLSPTPGQVKILKSHVNFSMSRYRASCLITWKFNEQKIRRILEDSCLRKEVLTV